MHAALAVSEMFRQRQRLHQPTQIGGTEALKLEKFDFPKQIADEQQAGESHRLCAVDDTDEGSADYLIVRANPKQKAPLRYGNVGAGRNQVVKRPRPPWRPNP